MKILITGVAGFIGMHLAQRLLQQEGIEVVGIDNLNDYYAVSLKQDRLKQLSPQNNFRFIEMDIADRPAMEALFAAKPARLRQQQCGGIFKCTGRLSPSSGRALGLRQQLQRLRLQHAHAVQHARQRRPPG